MLPQNFHLTPKQVIHKSWADESAKHHKRHSSLTSSVELQHFRDMRLQQLKHAKQQTRLLESRGHGVLAEVSQAHCQASKYMKLLIQKVCVAYFCNLTCHFCRL